MSIEKSIEGAIQDAMAAGAFNNLPGAGKPLTFSREQQAYAGDQWLGFKMLENGGYTPEWLSMGREIELDLERLAIIDRNHAEYCAAATRAEDWPRIAAAVDRLRESYEQLAREIRKKQDRFNHNAPGIRTQRPGLWVEYHIERLANREQASGRPA